MAAEGGFKRGQFRPPKTWPETGSDVPWPPRLLGHTEHPGSAYVSPTQLPAGRGPTDRSSSPPSPPGPRTGPGTWKDE